MLLLLVDWPGPEEGDEPERKKRGRKTGLEKALD